MLNIRCHTNQRNTFTHATGGRDEKELVVVGLGIGDLCSNKVNKHDVSQIVMKYHSFIHEKSDLYTHDAVMGGPVVTPPVPVGLGIGDLFV